MSKRKIFIIVLAVILIIAAIVAVFLCKKANEVTPQEMLEKFEEALGDEYKKQTQTEIAATLTYGNGDKENNIYYHIIKTTYFGADPTSVTGLNFDALHILFDPDCADGCQDMTIQDWDAALFNVGEESYLCWTVTPEVSYALEYDPEKVSDADIIHIAESVEPIKGEYIKK